MTNKSKLATSKYEIFELYLSVGLTMPVDDDGSLLKCMYAKHLWFAGGIPSEQSE